MNENYFVADWCDEEIDAYLLAQELFAQIQNLSKEIVKLREEVNSFIPIGASKPYAEPYSGIPYTLHYENLPAMRRYEEIFGQYIPEY
jgi:hypothetical protein